MPTMRSRVTNLEADVEELHRRLRAAELKSLVLEQQVETLERLLTEFRRALYPAFRRGFPEGQELERLFLLVEGLDIGYDEE
jgi:hypothetical protein